MTDHIPGRCVTGLRTFLKTLLCWTDYVCEMKMTRDPRYWSFIERDIDTLTWTLEDLYRVACITPDTKIGIETKLKNARRAAMTKDVSVMPDIIKGIQEEILIGVTVPSPGPVRRSSETTPPG